MVTYYVKYSYFSEWSAYLHALVMTTGLDYHLLESQAYAILLCQ